MLVIQIVLNSSSFISEYFRISEFLCHITKELVLKLVFINNDWRYFKCYTNNSVGNRIPQNKIFTNQ